MIVALCGFKGSGKSTAAKYLTAVHGFSALSFAGPLKKVLLDLGWSPAALYGPSSERERPDYRGVSARRACTALGDFGRDLAEDFWTQKAMDAAAARGGRVLFEDLRFPDEAEAVRRAGGRVLYLDAPDVEPPWYRRPFLHNSERAVFATRRLPFVTRIFRAAKAGDTAAQIQWRLGL